MSDAPPPYPQQPSPQQQPPHYPQQPYPQQPYPPQPPPGNFDPNAGYGAPPPGAPGTEVATADIRPKARWFWIGGAITTDSNVAIGKSVAGDLIRAILIPFLIAGMGFLLGLIVIIVTAVRRSGSKKRLASGH